MVYYVLLHTFIPSIRDIARRGLSARSVRRDRNTDNCLFSDKQASEICNKKMFFLSFCEQDHKTTEKIKSKLLEIGERLRGHAFQQSGNL